MTVANDIEEAVDNDQEAGVAGTTGVSRGQNQLHVLPEDWRTGAGVLETWLDRLDAESNAPQLLLVTSDVDAAAGMAARLAPLAAARRLRVLAATDARRAARVLRRGPMQVVLGAPEVLVELVQGTTLKLDAISAVALTWIDDLGVAGMAALETIMHDVPKDAARLILASAASPEVEQLVERYARRARRMQSVAGDSLPAVSLSYLAVGELARPMALRRILDAFDPESAYIVARAPDSTDDVQAHLRALGYEGDASAVRVGNDPPPDAAPQLVVLYDFPESETQLRRLVAERRQARVIALVTPRQLTTLRRWAGGSIAPLALPDAALRAHSREERLREEIREVLARGRVSRELVTLEPLFGEHDGVEVAAALLRLLELERAKPEAPQAAAAPAAMTTLFINVGEMDNVRAGDLVGAITNEAGISRSEIGRVEVREKHSTVEVATPVANAVVSKLTGVTIRGRRAMVKVDEGRERRDSGARRGGDRGSPRRDRPARPGRPTRPTRPR